MGGPAITLWHRLGVPVLVRQLLRQLCYARRLNTELAGVFPGQGNNYVHLGFFV